MSAQIAAQTARTPVGNWNPQFCGLLYNRRTNYLAGYSDGFLGYRYGSGGFTDDNPNNADYRAGFDAGRTDAKAAV